MKNRKSTGFIAIAGIVALLFAAWSGPSDISLFRELASIDSVPSVVGKLPLEEQAHRWQHVLPWMFLYIGPDMLLPFMSAIAAGIGFVLMFWQRLAGWVRRLWCRMFRRKA